MEPRNSTSAVVVVVIVVSKPNAVVVVVVVFFFQNQIYCIWSLHLAWLVQNTLRLTRIIIFPKVCTCYVYKVDVK